MDILGRQYGLPTRIDIPVFALFGGLFPLNLGMAREHRVATRRRAMLLFSKTKARKQRRQVHTAELTAHREGSPVELEFGGYGRAGACIALVWAYHSQCDLRLTLCDQCDSPPKGENRARRADRFHGPARADGHRAGTGAPFW